MARTASRAAAICVGFTALGCGGESGGAERSGGAKSEPARLVARLTQTAAKAQNAKDCKEVAAVNRRSRVKLICPPLTDDMRRTDRGTRPVAAAVYGSAAVVDYVSPGAKEGASAVLYRDPSGKWTIGRWGLSYGRTVGTTDDRREETRLALDRYLDAVRDRDCRSYTKYAATQSPDPTKACATEFPNTRALARGLRGNPSIAYSGGNEDIAFYRLTATNGTPYTVATVATAKGSLRSHVVLDVVPAPKN